MVGIESSRIVIVGGPRTGKTTLSGVIMAAFGLSPRHTDDLIETHEWGAAISEVENWLRTGGPWVIEGVTAAHALRRWLSANESGAPADIVVVTSVPHMELSDGQRRLGDQFHSVVSEIHDELVSRGVNVVSF